MELYKAIELGICETHNNFLYLYDRPKGYHEQYGLTIAHVVDNKFITREELTSMEMDYRMYRAVLCPIDRLKYDRNITDEDTLALIESSDYM